LASRADTERIAVSWNSDDHYIRAQPCRRKARRAARSLGRGWCPIGAKQPKRGFGPMKGKVWLDESFWEPLPEEELKLWEGA
jgi:hypothetical protein